MAVPNPINRKEKYLFKIATGGGEIPARPYTREEQYLEAIAMGGGGGGSSNIYFVDYDNPNIEELQSHIGKGDVIFMKNNFGELYWFSDGGSAVGYNFIKIIFITENGFTLQVYTLIPGEGWTWFEFPSFSASEEYGTYQDEHNLVGVGFTSEEFDNAPNEAFVCKETLNNVLGEFVDYLTDKIYESTSTTLTLAIKETTIVTNQPTALTINLPEIDSGRDYLTGVIFKAGASFAMTEVAPTGCTIVYDSEPTWEQGKIYEIIYRYLGIDGVISAKYSEVTVSA